MTVTHPGSERAIGMAPLYPPKEVDSFVVNQNLQLRTGAQR